ncbi:MAG: Rieske (2Fe-2S) protein [Deltaproteobacteria bacterium]|nr:Rieske (2Fe-2S) protein [Deltaproteobacteria bacterium]
MVHRQGVLDRRRSPDANVGAPLRLGTLAEIRQRLPLTVSFCRRRFRVAEVENELMAHPVECPHWGGPLDEAPIEDGQVVCPWHGYRFSVRSGKSCDGRQLQLGPAPRVRIDAATGSVDLLSDSVD